MFEKFKNLKGLFFRVDSRTIYLYSFFIGLVTGGVAILFNRAIHFLSHLFFDRLAQFPLDSSPSIFTGFTFSLKDPYYLLVLILPALGGLLVGICSHFFGPEAAGTGIDRMLDSFHNKGGQVRRRTSFVKFLTSTLTLSTGGSAGKEGPMALIGAGIGSLYSRIIRMGPRARRTLLLAGSAGGLGAIFRTPLGGAITTVEVLYKEDFETDALLPCIISSVTAYTIYCSALGFGHHLKFRGTIFSSPIELLFYIGLGLFCSLAGYFFIWVFRQSREKFFLKIPINKILRPAIGGLFIGIIGLLMPKAIGEGHGVLQGVIDGNYPQYWLTAALFLLALALLKMLATSITIQSGGSGGVLIPTLFIGAMLGGFYGTLCHQFFPEIVPSVTPYIVVGMAAFFSSVTNASLGALVMVTEITGGYELLPPLMTVAAITLITTHRWSLYKNQVKNKFSSEAHLWDMNPRNLKHANIRLAFGDKFHTRAIIRNNLSLREIEKFTQETQQSDLIVENDQGKLVGLFSLRDLYPEEEDLIHSKDILIAEDLITRPLYYVTLENSLYDAIKFLTDSDFDKVPVVRKKDKEPELLGYLRHQDILQYYYRMGLKGP